MDSNEDYEENIDSENIYSSSSNLLVNHGNTGPCNADNYLNYEFGSPFNFVGAQSKHASISESAGGNKPTAYSITSKTFSQKTSNSTNKNCPQCKSSAEPIAHVKLASLIKLKDSTRKLICLLEEIQSKTHSKNSNPTENRLTELIKPIPKSNAPPSVTEIIGINTLKKLESQAKTLEAIYIEDEDDDCSIYKRLTRKCHCLNQQQYNDFIIHFNEQTKYYSSTTGEIIKNMRILKKFLYMGGDYTKHALMFLNEGLSESAHTEKVEITQGCAYADVCNIFEDHSIVIICISWPCKYENYGDSQTQALTAGLLYKLSQLEEGRRYLNFSSKITNDLKKVLRKKASKLKFDTLESLNATLNLMHPPMAQHLNVTYYCKPADEGFGGKTVTSLAQYRQYMTLEEVLTHLNLLHNMSNNDNGKKELVIFLPAMLSLFKNLLMEYDNSEMNIVITNILNNIVSKSMIKTNECELPKTVVMADTTTEPILMKHETNQIPPRKNSKKTNKSKSGGLGMTPTKFRQLSKRKVAEWEPPQTALNRSRKFPKARCQYCQYEYLKRSEKLPKKEETDRK